MSSSCFPIFLSNGPILTVSSVFAFVGHFKLDHNDPESTPEAGGVLIAFSCLAIAAFATTWGPLSWAAVAELFPSQYRARCMALATAGNWICNL